MSYVNRFFFALCIIMLFVPAISVGGTLSTEEGASQLCPPTPDCSNLPLCKKEPLADQRDERDCKKTVLGLFTYHDSSCEAEQAKNNSLYAKQRSSQEGNYRQCFQRIEALKLQCEIDYTDWEICIYR